ncbi:MAG: maleylacetoacetate isomerase [Pseudomonadota bacterium]
MAESTSITLYTYWRSSASYRVRMALHLKGLRYESEFVHLVRDGGQQHQAAYTALNPQALVPTLLHGDTVLTQSLAILEYLEEQFPQPALLPPRAVDRARVRALANLIACDTHPLNNLRVLNYLTRPLDQDESAKLQWYQHWTAQGLDAFERWLSTSSATGRCCHGDQPTLADCCLLPQVYNARRFECDERGWPTIRRIVDHLQTIPAIELAAPENQPDAKS